MSQERSPSQADEDRRLAGRAALGDRVAFGALVRRHGSGVRLLLRRMGAQPSLADDLAQDAFVAAFEHLAALRAEGSFEGWVKTIAGRLYVKRWRKESRFEALPEDGRASATVSFEAAATETRLDLDAALEVLTAPERLCVVSCSALGLSHSEAAELLELPLGTVKSHVRRGLEKLKRRLSSSTEGDGVQRRDSNG